MSIVVLSNDKVSTYDICINGQNKIRIITDIMFSLANYLPKYINYIKLHKWLEY